MVCKTTYKEYKEDTASIAGWLAANAVKVGYKILSPIPQGGTRLKGKARKEAKAKGGKASPYTIVSKTAVITSGCGSQSRKLWMA